MSYMDDSVCSVAHYNRLGFDSYKIICRVKSSQTGVMVPGYQDYPELGSSYSFTCLRIQNIMTLPESRERGSNKP